MPISRFEIPVQWKLFWVCIAVTTAAISQQIPFELVQPTCELTYGRDVSIVSGIKSLLACSAVCTRDGQCLSVLYNPTTFACHTNHDVTQTITLPEGCGWMYVGLKLYGKPCSGVYSSERYRCVSDVYECAIGYAFNPSTEECVLGCLHYGNTFQLIPNYAIIGADEFVYGTPSLGDCKDRCLGHTGFVCVSFEFLAYSSECIVQPESGVYRSIVKHNGITIGHRNCA